MARTGRPPTPTAIKLLNGNPGKRPISKDEPQGQVGQPDMPRGLSKRAQSAWRSLAPALEGLKVVTREDQLALELLCEAYAEWRQARAVVQRKGATYEAKREDKDGNTYTVYVATRPEVQIAQNAWKRVMSGLQEFGLTPAARVRVKVVPKKEDEDPLAQLIRERAARSASRA